ncbi:MAG: hypothetical protein OXI77_11620 [Chloroflexota bacterium]|nr:hypothetical protein [Chloroflexota bacterium]MDE2909548.1 hypothetical protein [Chloroflexota bacterium]
MRSRMARLFRLSLLLALLVMSARAQSTPTVTITPELGEAERAVFAIEIDGLLPDTRYNVEIVFQSEVVFGSEEDSDQAGHIYYPISSTAGDLPGEYTLRALLDGEVVASGVFTLTAAAPPTAAGEFLGEVTVSPSVAPFGKVHQARIAALEPRAQYTVEITARETGQEAYRRPFTSDDEGVITLEIFAEEGDAAGLQSIAVYDADGELAAEGEFTIQRRPQRQVWVALSPATVAVGGSVEISLGGLAAFDSVTAQVTTADGVLIDTILARASSNGEALLTYATPAELAAGAYQLVFFIEGARLASATLIIGDAARSEGDVTLSINPLQGPIGTRHTIDVAGLAADQAFSLIILDPAGAEEYRASSQTDAAGEFSLTISSTAEDDTGVYTVEIRAEDGAALLAAASFEVRSAEDEMESLPAAPSDEDAPVSDATVSIEPQSAPIGSSHLVTVRNLSASEIIGIDVVFAGASVYSTEKTADDGGFVRLELVTSDSDAPGDYTVNIRRASGNQPAVILTATAMAAPVQASTTVGGAEAIAGSLIDGRAEIVFDGKAGQVLLISVASDDFDPAAALLDGDDAELAFNDDSRGQKDALIGPMTLPYSGQYALSISAAPLMMPQGAQSGDFQVTITSISLMPISFDTDIQFALSADTPALYFSLPVQTGDSLSVSLDSGGALDTLLQVVSPAGEEYAFDDDSGAGFDAELSNLIFDRAAAYVLVVSTFDGGVKGAGTFTVSRNPVHSLDAGAVTIALSDKAIRDLVVFDAAEDELLVLNLEVISGHVEDLYVTATIEGMEVMSYSTMGVPDELPLAFVTPMSGRVVVTLEKFGYDDGIALDVSLERP